jgi:glycosyltransferase involved in cell wall biosynthesis
MAKALAKKGVNITFVLPQKVNVNCDFMNIVFADIEDSLKELQGSYASYSEWVKTLGTGVNNVSPFDFIGGALRYAEKIKHIARKYNSDLIHAHDWLTYPAGIVAKGITGKPLVAHVHATEFDRTGGHYPNPIVYAIEKMGFEKADRILPVGGFMKSVISNNYGIDPAKIQVVYNGIEREYGKYLPPALTPFKELGYKIILYLGRITLQKGPEYFVRAAKIVSDYYPKALFVVTGSGDMKDFMVAEAARLGILDKFMFTGFLRGEDRDRIFRAADLYVMPSVSEPFGITALEAIANGTPVLISKQSGVSEVLNNSLKADFWDIEEMANKILAVIKYKSLPKDLKNEGGKEINNLTWDRTADRILDVYHQLI